MVVSWKTGLNVQTAGERTNNQNLADPTVEKVKAKENATLTWSRITTRTNENRIKTMYNWIG